MKHSHTRSRARAALLVCAICLSAALPASSWAALGEQDDSVLADQAQVKGSLKSINRANFRVHELQLPSGTTVREYVSTTGLVFAVTWNGPAMPDLRQFLGQYFDSYVAGAQSNRSGHRQLQFQSKDLIVHAAGHMRMLTGQAYLESALPAGVTAGDLQ